MGYLCKRRVYPAQTPGKMRVSDSEAFRTKGAGRPKSRYTLARTMPLPTGKLPAELLERLLRGATRPDPRVLVGPAIGEDAAVISLSPERALIAKADPVTFATDLIGWYAVHVNANDVACMGARPAWFMATVLLPEGASERLAEDIFSQVASACRALDVTLIGGHTEVTHGLSRPIVAGAMLAEADPRRVVRNSGGLAGDHIVLSKGIAIEGTALVARDAAAALQARGVPAQTLEGAARLLFEPGISVVREALLAHEAVSVHAMHDPTEGGLATALVELATACRLGVVLRLEDVPVLPETAAICRAVGLEPLGLLASGSLLIVVAEEDCEGLRSTLSGAGIAAACIGRLAPAGEGAIMVERGSRRSLPRFERDELARFFDSLGTTGARAEAPSSVKMGRLRPGGRERADG